MRGRDVALIPLYLWVSASICLHIASYFGTSEVALRWYRNHPPSAQGRGGAGASAEPAPSEVEFTYIPPHEDPTTPPENQPPVPATDPQVPPPPPAHDPQALARVAPPPRHEPEPPPPQAPPPTAPTTPPPPQAMPQPPPNMARMQHVDQENHDNEATPDNPAFLAQSNHNVAEQTVAAARNLNNNDPHPQVGGTPAHSAAQALGNGDRAVSADDRDRAGDARHVPSTSPHPSLTPTAAPRVARTETSSGNAAQGEERRPGRAGERGAPGSEGAAGTAGATSVATSGTNGNVLTANGGVGVLPPIGTGIPMQTGEGGAGGQGGRNGRNGQGGDAGTRVGVAGMGAAQAVAELTPTQVTYNQVFGAAAERERRVAQLRRSQARGSYTESWRENRAAIENYTPTIRVGNQTALRTAASPFSAYLTAMHRRIHRLFADTFLEGLNAAPSNSPLNDHTLVTTVEIVLFRDGRIRRLGVARTSGNTAFDVGALNSVRRSAPFGNAPDAIVSGDGSVYVRWAFHRDDNACGTWNAEPYILPNPGGPAPAGPNPTPGPTPRDEHPPRTPSTVGQREPSAPVRGGVSGLNVDGLSAGARVANR